MKFSLRRQRLTPPPDARRRLACESAIAPSAGPAHAIACGTDRGERIDGPSATTGPGIRVG